MLPIGGPPNDGVRPFSGPSRGKHVDAKPLKGYGGAGVLEVVEDHQGDTFRAVYAVKFAGAVYVLHAFSEEIEEGHSNAEGRSGLDT